MSKGLDKVVIILVGLVFTSLLVYYFVTRDKYNWNENYKTHSEEPYDLNLLYNLLDQATDDSKRNTDQRLSEFLAGQDGFNYFFVSDEMYLDSASALELLKFIDRGNSAFISTPFLDMNLIALLQERDLNIDRYQYVEADSLSAQLHEGKMYDFNYRRGDKYVIRDWAVGADAGTYSDSMAITELGFATINTNYYINFFSLEIGEGTIYFHTEPLLFTNYFLSKPGGFEYTSKVLSHLPARAMVWEVYHTNYYATAPEALEQPQQSPLRYILSQPGLRTAWYLLLVGVVVFLVFKTKRQQRIIPLVGKVENTSIEFAKSLGTLYHKSGNAGSIAKEMLRLFDNFNRRQYGIDRKPWEGDFSDIISKKSKVKPELVKQILKLEDSIVYNPSSRVRDIIPLYHLLQEYYKKAKK